MLKATQVALDLLREAAWRKWFLGLFLTITGVLILLGFSLQLDVVDGAIAGSSLFGEVLFSEIRTASSAKTAPFDSALRLGAASRASAHDCAQSVTVFRVPGHAERRRRGRRSRSAVGSATLGVLRLRPAASAQDDR